jgi:phage antirepressor YoqD-like protein
VPRAKPFRPDREFFQVFYVDEGLTIAELAELCGAGQTTIRTWMTQDGIPRRDARYTAKGKAT